MKTPRIEETINKIVEAGKQRADWFEPSAEVILATTAKEQMLKAHQAGRDEAVEEAVAREKQLRDIHKIELDTISCMSLEQFVVWSDQRKQPKDNIIKALKDNK